MLLEGISQEHPRTSTTWNYRNEAMLLEDRKSQGTSQRNHVIAKLHSNSSHFHYMKTCSRRAATKLKEKHNNITYLVSVTHFVHKVEQLTAGPHKVFLFISQNKTEWQWLKGYWILAKWVPINFANKLGQTERKKKLFVWPCGNVGQMDKMLVYGILCVTMRAN